MSKQIVANACIDEVMIINAIDREYNSNKYYKVIALINDYPVGISCSKSFYETVLSQELPVKICDVGVNISHYNGQFKLKIV